MLFPCVHHAGNVRRNRFFVGCRLMNGIFRKNIDPRCIYCSRGSSISDNEVICLKRGIVEAYGSCRSFRYDPFKRIPPKPVRLSKNYSDSDFKL